MSIRLEAEIFEWKNSTFPAAASASGASGAVHSNPIRLGPMPLKGVASAPCDLSSKRRRRDCNVGNISNYFFSNVERGRFHLMVK